MAFLRATACALPERIVDNDELAALVGESAEWIRNVTGIEQRRYAEPEQTVEDLAVLAANACLQRAGVVAEDLGLLLVSSGSSERFCPGPACTVAARLGLAATPAFDIPVASAGSLVALNMAMQFAPAVGKVLVIGSEIMSRRIDRTPEGRNTAILFGDGAGAALIDPAEGVLNLTDAALFTDGNGAEVLSMEGKRLHMDGGSVILRASRKLPAAIQTILARNALTPDAIAHYILHQANLNLLNKVASTLKVSAGRFFTNIERYGNTSSASLLIALDEWLRSTAQPVSGPVILSAFGAGLNWGALLAVPVPFGHGSPE